MNSTPDKAFDEAIEHHQKMLEQFGADHPITIEAIQIVMLLAPLELFAEIEQMAHATHH